MLVFRVEVTLMRAGVSALLSMKAIVVREFGPPEVMKLEKVELAEPAGLQVLVKIEAAGVNPVDTYLRTGIHAHAPKLPYTPGKDGAGTVAAVGDAAGKFKPGDRVYTAGSITGTYAEYSLCDESQLGALPENVGFEEGAALWTPYATAYRALFQKAAAKPGETVLIHGASGGVGIAAIQWGRRAGLRIIGTAGSAEGIKLAREMGAEAVFNHSESDHLQRILDFTGGRGVDVIIEMLANENLERDFDALAMFGRIVIVGSRDRLQFTPRLAMTKDAVIFGMSLFNAPKSDLNEIHNAIYDALAAGDLRPVIRTRYSLSEAPEAHHAVIESRALGKIVLTV